MKYYYIECEICDEQSQVTVENSSPEPEFCPICGHVTPVNFLDEEDDSD